jgi:di/tricarboxylate transporter
MALPPVTTGMLVVFGLILVALALFVSEAIPADVTAIGVLVALAVLEPFTGVAAADAIAGFASTATVTILAMYILSEGVQQTGVVERLGAAIARVTKGDETRLLAATVGTTGVSAGVVNNTPVVAVFIPMVTGLAERAGISRSKLLLPLSYAAMLGGTLTLIGTATNLLASDFARELPGRGPIGMFEFTPLGVLVLLVGVGYLLTVGRWLTPARVPPDEALTAGYDLDDRLTRFAVPADSELVGQSVDEVVTEFEAFIATTDLLQVERDGETFHARGSDQTVAAGDRLTVRATAGTSNRLARRFGLRRLAREDVSEADLLAGQSVLAETVVPPDSALVGATVADSRLEERFDATVLAVLRGEDLVHEGLGAVAFEAGDTVLVYTTPADLRHLGEDGGLAPTRVPGDAAALLGGFPDANDTDADDDEAEPTGPSLGPTAPYALSIMAGVIGLAALGLVPIVIAALGGVFAMVVTGCLTASDAYDAVSWNVVFLLAGVLPLGTAMQRTGGAEFIAALLVGSADVLPVLAVLALFYLLTGVLANIITPVASVVLMIPVAVDTATRIGGEPFSFLLAVTFAASAAFATPIGYQTNLMVYGPGGYRFTDYLRVGAPLQLILTVVVTLGIAALFGV